MSFSLGLLLKNDYAFSVFSKIAIIPCNVLATIFLNRYLGPELKGQYAYILNIINLLIVILNLGIYQAYPFFRRSGLENITRNFINIFVLQFITYILLGLLISIFARDIIITVVSILVPCMVFAQQLNFIIMVENIRLSNIINIIHALLFASAFFYLFAFTAPNLLSALGANYIKCILITIILLFFFRFTPIVMNRSLLKEALVFGFYPMLTGIMLILNYRIGVFILGNYASYSEIGYFTTGLQLAEFAWIVPEAFKDVLFSRTARSDAIKEVVLALKFNFWLAILMVVSIVVWGKDILYILYGKEFLPAYGVTIVMFIGVISMVYFKLIGTLFLAKGEKKVYFYVLFGSVALNVLMSFIMIPMLGTLGAAVATVISYTITGIIFLTIFQRNYHIPWKEFFVINNKDIQIIYGALKRKES